MRLASLDASTAWESLGIGDRRWRDRWILTRRCPELDIAGLKSSIVIRCSVEYCPQHPFDVDSMAVDQTSHGVSWRMLGAAHTAIHQFCGTVAVGRTRCCICNQLDAATRSWA